MLSLTKTFEFSAAHRLFSSELSEEENRRIYGKCAHGNGHGHNYRLEVWVSGQVSEQTGMIIDASKLDALVREEILAYVDHKNLDIDVPWLEGRPSTVENLVDAFWKRLEPEVRKHCPTGQLFRIVLWETSRIFATKERGNEFNR